ncbi:MAG TPA: hypothetical protein PKA39_07275 [Ignavibacteria bacterium]|nr:hypothetical protein [Ignavibacteria bacterium]
MIRIFIALLMLSGGNFVFALAHGDCFIGSDVHITCEMECCQENPCIDDETSGKVEITDETNSCCKTHVDEALTGDIPLPVIAKSCDNISSLADLPAVELLFPQSNGLCAMIHKNKTTNILLTTSILRI